MEDLGDKSFRISREVMKSKAGFLVGSEQIRKNLESLRNLVFSNISNYKQYTEFLDINGNVLLYGKPGTGKTSICYECMLADSDASCYNVNISTLISEKLGKTPNLINDFFEVVINDTSKYRVFLLLEEIEAFLPNRSNSKDLDDMKRALTVFMHYLDMRTPNLMILCTTNYKSLLDPAILRRFCFKYEVVNNKQDFIEFFISPNNPFHAEFENNYRLEELANNVIEKKLTFSDLKFIMRSLCFSQHGVDFKNVSVENLYDAINKWEENNE